MSRFRARAATKLGGIIIIIIIIIRILTITIGIQATLEPLIIIIINIAAKAAMPGFKPEFCDSLNDYKGLLNFCLNKDNPIWPPSHVTCNNKICSTTYRYKGLSADRISVLWVKPFFV